MNSENNRIKLVAYSTRAQTVIVAVGYIRCCQWRPTYELQIAVSLWAVCGVLGVV